MNLYMNLLSLHGYRVGEARPHQPAGVTGPERDARHAAAPPPDAFPASPRSLPPCPPVHGARPTVGCLG